MKCDQVHEAFSDYFDNNLDSNRKTAFEEHLAICENCRADFESLQVYWSSVKGLDKLHAPKNLNKKIIQQLNTPNKKQSGNFNKIRLYAYITGLAAAMLVLFYFIAPDHFFKPPTFDVVYVVKIEKKGKGNEKSSNPITDKAEVVKRKIQELKILLEYYGETVSKETKVTSTGEADFIQVKIQKKDYPEFAKRLNELFSQAHLALEVPYTFSKYCFINIEIK